MGFKFSSAGPHPPTYCATSDIFRCNLKVGSPLLLPSSSSSSWCWNTKDYVVQLENIWIEGVFHPSYQQASVDTEDNVSWGEQLEKLQ